MHAAVNERGCPYVLVLGAGQQADCVRAEELLAAIPKRRGKPLKIVADKGYDTDSVRRAIRRKRAGAVIPAKKNRRKKPRLDRGWYRQRNRVERFFNRFKDFRRLATRYEKTAASYLGFVHFFAALCWCQ